MLGLVLSAAAVHEVGHWLALRFFRADILGVQVGILGAVMEIDAGRLSYGKELAAVLAGPGSNLLCACLLAGLTEGREAAIGAQLVLGAFNLLPIRPLDGGCALYLLITWILGPDWGERIVRCVGMLTATGVVMVLGYLMWRTGGSLWLLPAAGGILLAAWKECF